MLSAMESNLLNKNMRKITVLAMISLDGVIQAPGGPREDTSGFKYGGWAAPWVIQ